MRRIEPCSLWIGHAGSLRDFAALRSTGIHAIVDLAMEGTIPPVARDTCYSRFPIVDGAGNERWVVRAAMEHVALLLRSEVPLLVACGAGMSRSPAIAAGAMAIAFGESPGACLKRIANTGPCDVSPATWDAVMGAVGEGAGRPN